MVTRKARLQETHKVRDCRVQVRDCSCPRLGADSEAVECRVCEDAVCTDQFLEFRRWQAECIKSIRSQRSHALLQPRTPDVSLPRQPPLNLNTIQTITVSRSLTPSLSSRSSLRTSPGHRQNSAVDWGRFLFDGVDRD